MGGQTLKMQIMLWVEVQKVVAVREYSARQSNKNGIKTKQSAKEMILWMFQKYSDVAANVNNESTEMVKKIFAVIGIR